MFDKMKALMDAQKNMREIKRRLEDTSLEVLSSDGLVKVTMSASQEVKEVSIQAELKDIDKSQLEKSIQDAYNKAIKRAQEIAAVKMKEVMGFDLPGIG
ncbi:MAG: YbaB/EbfC family nucleoid-associated protein [Candidatus Omnitrophica bacterium]|nr:YbaB/EbfC family nucleoid-associated protein [Candidatus Omnitrophota bacterium]